MMLPAKRLAGPVAACVLVLAPLAPAQAHPHVWIDVALEMPVSETGAVKGVTVTWAFDEMYSAATVLGMDTDGDGATSPEELEPLIQDSMTNLLEWHYFLDVRQGGARLETDAAVNASGAFENGQLIYRYTVPLKAPADLTAAPLEVRSFDPSFYIDLALREEAPVVLPGAPDGCAAQVTEPPPMDETMLLMGESALLNADFAPGSEGLGGKFAQKVTVTCAPR